MEIHGAIPPTLDESASSRRFLALGGRAAGKARRLCGGPVRTMSDQWRGRISGVSWAKGWNVELTVLQIHVDAVDRLSVLV